MEGVQGREAVEGMWPPSQFRRRFALSRGGGEDLTLCDTFSLQREGKFLRGQQRVGGETPR